MKDQLRRHSVGAPAARSVLLTVLGEYLLATDDGVWQETLVGALETMGYRTQAARQALARSVTAGWLRTERIGRRSRVRLREETADMLRTGAERIYGFGEPWEWDGRWLLVALRVPEERRDVRHQARTRLAWEGFGSLGGGLWISPHVEREGELLRLVDESVADLTSFRAEIGALGDPARVVADAWDLDAVASAYRDFVARFARLRPTRPAPSSAPRPSSCTPGASSPSSIPTCPRRSSPPAGHARAPTTSSASVTRSGTDPRRSTSARSRTGAARPPRRSQRRLAGQMPCLPGERMPLGSRASLSFSLTRRWMWSLKSSWSATRSMWWMLVR